MTRPVRRHDPTAPLRPGLRALEASAGTGKTWQITSTLLRLVVTEGLATERLLVVTFTRAATEELAERVRTRLAEGAEALAAAAEGRDARVVDDVLGDLVAEARAGRPGLEVARARVEAALRDVDQAAITTIHGFCQRVLAAAAFLTPVDVHLDLDERDVGLVTQVVDDHYVALLHDADPRVLAALDECKVSPDALRAIGLAAVGEPDPRIVPEDVLDVGAASTALVDAWDATLAAVHRHGDDLVAAGQQAVDDGQQRGNGRWKPVTLRKCLDHLAEALAAGAVPARGGTASRERLHPDGCDGEMPDHVRDTAVVRAVVRYEQALLDLAAAVRVDVARHTRSEVDRRRADDGSAGFTDLLRRAAEALAADRGVDGATGPLHAHLRDRYAAVLVDEFQDTDPLQWGVLGGLFADTDAFLEVVGDPKQSIYGWRGADLDTFLGVLDEAGERVGTMVDNHRSDGDLVAACNAVMDATGTFSDHKDVPYVPVRAVRDRARLHDGGGGPRSGLALVRHPRSGAKPLTKDEAARRAAADTAEDVLDVLEQGWATHDGPVQPRDLAVLVRTNRQAQVVAEALRRRGVPVVVGGGEDVLVSAEAGDVAALLDAMLAPADEQVLRRVLVGPFGGRTAAELVGMSADQWDDAFAMLAGWTLTWERSGSAAAVEQALREGGAERRLAAVEGGDRRVTNLRHLGELLHRAERDEAVGGHALATWFAARRAAALADLEQPTVERELRLERDAAAVRVMTIHTSKGLEFPLVWVPFAWDDEVRARSVTQDARPFVVTDPRHDRRRTLVLGPTGSSAVGDTDEVARLRALGRLEDWEAGHRLLYVALTRAVHRCTVHVAPTARMPVSSAHHLLLRHQLGVVQPAAPGDRPPGPAEDVAIDEALRGLAARADGGRIEVRTARTATGPGRRWDPGALPDDDDLAVRRWGRTTGWDDWTLASFTGLLRSRGDLEDPAAAADDAARDHDEVVPGEPAEPVPVVGPSPDVPLAALPRGPAVGTYVHDVLEHVDFAADPAGVLRVVTDRLGGHGDVELGDAGRRALAAGLHAALETPMGRDLDDLRLAEVARGDRLDELEFALGMPDRLRLGDVAEVFAAHAADDVHAGVPLGAAAERLRGGRPVRGLLTGFVDLVLRTPAGVWVVDYKTNALGEWSVGEDGTRTWVEQEHHHHPDRVMERMLHGDYLLQAHLYAVAVRRWLRAAAGPAAPPVLGWAYLFVRGMVGPGTRATDDGRRFGVATGRPGTALLDDLDRALGGTP